MEPKKNSSEGERDPWWARRILCATTTGRKLFTVRLKEGYEYEVLPK